MLPKSSNAIERNHNPTKTSHGPQREIKIVRILPSKKAFKGVSYSFIGLGATVGY